MGARMLRDQLARQGIHAGRRHIRTLMLRMGIEALAPQPGTSKRAPQAGLKKWLRLFEQLSPIYKWIPGGLRTVTRGAPKVSSYAANFNCGKAARYFSCGVSRSRLECG